jgi:hypothetical protein
MKADEKKHVFCEAPQIYDDTDENKLLSPTAVMRSMPLHTASVEKPKPKPHSPMAVSAPKPILASLSKPMTSIPMAAMAPKPMSVNAQPYRAKLQAAQSPMMRSQMNESKQSLSSPKKPLPESKIRSWLVVLDSGSFNMKGDPKRPRKPIAKTKEQLANLLMYLKLGQPDSLFEANCRQ